jgi:mRNA-degrading endonuclease RelE of RelBE toxin-antitoxin system
MFHIFVTPTFERSIKKIKDKNIMIGYVDENRVILHLISHRKDIYR